MRQTSDLSGILLVDKAAEWTSHDVVAKARRITGQRKIGHTGTLDPAATGLLVLCLGKATRFVEYMVGHGKRYEGQITLGAATDTDDADGSVISRGEVPSITPELLVGLEARFSGVIQQVPPAYSAVKVDGQRAHAVARKGLAQELAPRQVEISELRLSLVAPEHLSVQVACGAGTYVRSLARDIGQVLGCGAHLSALRRTAAGPFVIEQAITLAELQEVADAGLLRELLLAPDEGLLDRDAALLNASSRRALLAGSAIEVAPEEPPHGGILRLYGTNGEFYGVGSMEGRDLLRPRKVLGPA